jgi:hypothetical protein
VLGVYLSYVPCSVFSDSGVSIVSSLFFIMLNSSWIHGLTRLTRFCPLSPSRRSHDLQVSGSNSHCMGLFSFPGPNFLRERSWCWTSCSGRRRHYCSPGRHLRTQCQSAKNRRQDRQGDSHTTPHCYCHLCARSSWGFGCIYHDQSYWR